MPLIKRIVICLSVVQIITNGAVFAGEKAGATAAQILEITPSARATGMGGAFCAVADDVSSIYYNPAGLANVAATEIPFSSNQRPEGVNIQFVAVAYNMRDLRALNVENLGTIAAGFTTMDFGDITARDIAGAATGVINPRSSNIAIAYGRPVIRDENIGNILVGATAKFFEEKYQDETFRGEAFDAGAYWEDPCRNLSLGAALLNMGNRVSYAAEEFKLPFNVRIGGAVRMLNDSLVLAGDYNAPAGAEAGYNAGLEYWLVNTIALRAGYDSRYDLGTGITAGLGIRLSQLDVLFLFAREININYAFKQSNLIDSTHLLSVILKLGAD